MVGSVGSQSESGQLSGIRVVEFGSTMATAIATMVLADAGADVVLVEPPGGVGLRRTPGFRTWGRNKRSVRIDVHTSDGRRRLSDLLARADVLVHSVRPSEAVSWGLDDATLSVAHPHLIVSSVLGWPANHADAGVAVDDHLVLARLGVLDEQQGRREGPIFVRFPLGSWCAAWLAVVGVMARIVCRDRGGAVGPAHTSLAQGALIPMMMHWSRAETPGPMLSMGMPKNMMRATLFECSDGRWIHVMPPSPDDTPLMRRVWDEMGADAVAAANERHRGDGMPGWGNWGAMVEAFRRRTSDEWLADLWSADVPVQKAARLGEIFDDEQTRVNHYVVDVDDPELGPITVGGFPLTLDPPCSWRHPVPSLVDGEDDGEDDGGVEAEWLSGPVRADRAVAVEFGSPLEGLKVVDFGNFLAGPLGPMLLADLGATVVKVEQATGDPMRGVEWPFAGCQRGKLDIALDMKSPDARPAVERILRWADVVHHNLRRPAARRLGLDADAVRAVNPGVVFCHVSSYGPVGPRADWPGYDQLFQASCGWEYEGAGEGNPPMWHRFGFMDHLCAMASAAATLMAVHHRHVTGRATDVATSLLATGALTNSETYVRSDGTIAPVPSLDRDQTATGPGRRIFAVRDGWVATASDGIIVDPARFATLTVETALERLHSDGLDAERVRLEQRYPFFDDHANIESGLVARYRHGSWGMFEQPGAMWWLGNQSCRLDRAPSVLGEHTREALRLVGVDDPTIERLVANGVAVQHGS